VRHLLAATVCALYLSSVFAAEPPPKDTPKAAKTRELLKKKVDFEWKDTSFGDVVQDMKDQIKGLSIRVDTKSGVNLNKQITFKAKDVSLEDAIEMLIAKNGWGYYVESQQNSAYDGILWIKVGKERGWKGIDGKPEAKKD
jgi:hypothetical protein